MSSAARLTLIAASRLSRSSRMSRQALFENGHKHPRHVIGARQHRRKLILSCKSAAAHQAPERQSKRMVKSFVFAETDLM